MEVLLVGLRADDAGHGGDVEAEEATAYVVLVMLG